MSYSQSNRSKSKSLKTSTPTPTKNERNEFKKEILTIFEKIYKYNYNNNKDDLMYIPPTIHRLDTKNKINVYITFIKFELENPKYTDTDKVKDLDFIETNYTKLYERTKEKNVNNITTRRNNITEKQKIDAKKIEKETKEYYELQKQMDKNFWHLLLFLTSFLFSVHI